MDTSLQASEAGGVKGIGALEGPPFRTIEATAVQADPAPTYMMKVVSGGIGAQGGPPTVDIPANQLPRPPEEEWSDGNTDGCKGIAIRDKVVIAQDTLPRPPEVVETHGAPVHKAAITEEELWAKLAKEANDRQIKQYMQEARLIC